MLNLAKAIVELLAKQVVLQPNTNVTLNVKELQITAQDTGSTTAGDVFLNVVKKVYESDCNYVGIKNMTITAEKDDDGDSQIVIKATNAVTSNTDAATTTDGTTAADTSETGIWAKVDSKVGDLGSYIASVKNIETIIEIDASTLTADTIDLESVNELKMSTQGVGIGVAVNVASASSMVLVKNSNLTSTKNGIKLLAKSVIESKADAQAKAGNVAVGVSVISGSTEASITGSGTINSKKGLLVSAESNAQATTNAIGKAANDNRSGAFAGVSIVNYDTKANIGGTVSVQANEDVTVKSQQYGINGTTVRSTQKSDDESSSGDKSSSISSILDWIYLIRIGIQGTFGCCLYGFDTIQLDHLHIGQIHHSKSIFGHLIGFHFGNLCLTHRIKGNRDFKRSPSAVIEQSSTITTFYPRNVSRLSVVKFQQSISSLRRDRIADPITIVGNPR